MARVVYAAAALADLERLFDFAAVADGGLAAASVEAITEAVGILAHHPFIGRSVDGGLRELVISRGKTGYLALYAWFEEEEVVMVLAMRHQREVGHL